MTIQKRLIVAASAACLFVGAGSAAFGEGAASGGASSGTSSPASSSAGAQQGASGQQNQNQGQNAQQGGGTTTGQPVPGQSQQGTVRGNDSAPQTPVDPNAQQQQAEQANEARDTQARQQGDASNNTGEATNENRRERGVDRDATSGDRPADQSDVSTSDPEVAEQRRQRAAEQGVRNTAGPIDNTAGPTDNVADGRNTSAEDRNQNDRVNNDNNNANDTTSSTAQRKREENLRRRGEANDNDTTTTDRVADGVVVEGTTGGGVSTGTGTTQTQDRDVRVAEEGTDAQTAGSRQPRAADSKLPADDPKLATINREITRLQGNIELQRGRVLNDLRASNQEYRDLLARRDQTDKRVEQVQDRQGPNPDPAAVQPAAEEALKINTRISQLEDAALAKDSKFEEAQAALNSALAERDAMQSD